RSKTPERIVDSGAPIGAGDELARFAVGTIGQRGLMQAESDLDDVGNSILGDALALLIFEGVGVTARCEKSLLEMLGTDDAEMMRGHRLAVLAHHCPQLGDALAVDLIDAEELRERLMRAADLGEHLALDGTPGKPTELANKFPHGAMAIQIAIP